MTKNEYLAKHVFYGLANISIFEHEIFFSEQDFAIVLERVKSLGIGIGGIEAFQGNMFCHCETPALRRNRGKHWYTKAFERLKKAGEFQYSATFSVPIDKVDGWKVMLVDYHTHGEFRHDEEQFMFHCQSRKEAEQFTIENSTADEEGFSTAYYYICKYELSESQHVSVCYRTACGDGWERGFEIRCRNMEEAKEIIKELESDNCIEIDISKYKRPKPYPRFTLQ
jgi:hypothetical protein